MKTRKEKAINLILLGLALKFFPLLILGLFTEPFSNLFFGLRSLISFLIFGLFIVGYVFFIKGCCLYTESKGYSNSWGWIGLFSYLGLSILFLLPYSKNIAFLPDEKLPNNHFAEINIAEILLSLTSLVFSLVSILGIFSSLNNLNYSELVKQPSINNLLGIVLVFYWSFLLFTQMRLSDLSFKKIVGYKNHVNLKLISVVVVVTFAFFWSFNSLTLYSVSFVFPNYVEYLINEKYFTNISEMIFWGISVMFLAPLIEELFFRGISSQKWSIKWGVRSGILASSLLFAIVHLRFDIISLFIMGVLYSILYFKTRNLITPILCHFFHNSLVFTFKVIDYFSTSTIKRNTITSVEAYQASIQPLLGQKILIATICVSFLIYFISKNFPKNNSIIPYYVNEA